MTPRRALLASACVVVLSCGTNVDLGGRSDGGGKMCAGFASPTTPAKCIACAPDSGGFDSGSGFDSGRFDSGFGSSGFGSGWEGGNAPCQANGCYGGYYCYLPTLDCRPAGQVCDEGGGD